MGERGPARTPAVVAKARGTYRADRHGDGSFNPDVRIPEPPGTWEEGGYEDVEWSRVTAELQPFGLVTELDRPVLIRYCEAWAMSQRAYEDIQEFGAVLTDDKGRRYANPAVLVYDKAVATVLACSKRFGFTPSDRTGIKATNTPKPQSEVDSWQSLKGGKAG